MSPPVSAPATRVNGEVVSPLLPANKAKKGEPSEKKEKLKITAALVAKIATVAIVMAGLVAATVASAGAAAPLLAAGSYITGCALVGASVGCGLSALATPFLGAFDPFFDSKYCMYEDRPGHNWTDTAKFVGITALSTLCIVPRLAYEGLKTGIVIELIKFFAGE